MTVISVMDCVNGQYQYHLPVAFHPDYIKHNIGDKSWAYSFGYEVRIRANTPISNMIIPEFSSVVEQNETKTEILITSDQSCANINLFYKTADMKIPDGFFAKKGDEVACVAAAVPTFEAVSPQDFFEVLQGEDESPEQDEAWTGEEFHFVFVIDRSGSMNFHNRIDLAKQALELFIRSLPKACKVSIIGFCS